MIWPGQITTLNTVLAFYWYLKTCLKNPTWGHRNVAGFILNVSKFLNFHFYLPKLSLLKVTFSDKQRKEFLKISFYSFYLFNFSQMHSCILDQEKFLFDVFIFAHQFYLSFGPFTLSNTVQHLFWILGKGQDPILVILFWIGPYLLGFVNFDRKFPLTEFIRALSN